MDSYHLFKHIHIAFVVITFISFTIRAWWMLSSPELLKKLWVKVIPPIIDTILLASAIRLTFIIDQYPFVNSWLTAKVLALIGYIVFGAIALTRGRTKSLRIMALFISYALFFYIVAVAHSKHPIPWG
ncbi:SirB2 family protein [Candidatus Nitrosacidococcus sp. I8]|uniref:SirB2 family protein n=1 Tax=Candidatus Nitrosacidococcus sp. I8 TaxID=2942908 RepID=UPI0022277D2A|nr:SirB2 family protein [Candidatus Nitrosacidococcus sp. I8]CAH9017156.1 Protein YchQ [Candidatus Nitrosacidococcus sp. I8]